MTGAEIAIVGLMAAGTGLTAYSTYQQGKSAEQQAKAEAAWNSYNAKVAQRNAEAEKASAKFEAMQQERRAKALLSKQRTLIAKSGIEFEGSPLLVAEDTAAQLALENTNIRMQGLRRTEAYKNQSILDIYSANAAKSRASSYGSAAGIGAGASLLTGLGQTAYMDYKIKNGLG